MVPYCPEENARVRFHRRVGQQQRSLAVCDSEKSGPDCEVSGLLDEIPPSGFGIEPELEAASAVNSSSGQYRRRIDNAHQIRRIIRQWKRQDAVGRGRLRVSDIRAARQIIPFCKKDSRRPGRRLLAKPREAKTRANRAGGALVGTTKFVFTGAPHGWPLVRMASESE
jgi:hypothetical protein